MKTATLIFHMDKQIEEISHEFQTLPSKGDIICYKQTDYTVYKVHYDLDLQHTTLHLKKHFT